MCVIGPPINGFWTYPPYKNEADAALLFVRDLAIDLTQTIDDIDFDG